MTDYEREVALSEIRLAMQTLGSGSGFDPYSVDLLAKRIAIGTGRASHPYFARSDEAMLYLVLMSIEMQLKGRGNGN